MGGIQFASPMAIDRLRKARNEDGKSAAPEIVAIPAVDPGASRRTSKLCRDLAELTRA